MSQPATKDRVHSIIAEHLCKEPGEVQDDTLLIADLGADSLDIVEIQMALEEEFKMEIDDSEVDDLRTVSEAVDLIERKLVAKQIA